MAASFRSASPILVLRLCAAGDAHGRLDGLPVPFVFSHDSIGIGRNGPTHQPVEILASLRAMPNMLVLRPADAVEAAECWEIALDHRTGPSALIFCSPAAAAGADACTAATTCRGTAPMCFADCGRARAGSRMLGNRLRGVPRD